MAEKFVIVHRSYDPILIEHLGEMLREADIVARVIGTRDAAIIGVGPSINELHLSVPESQAADATDFLEDFFKTEGAELLEEQGLLDDDDEEDDDEDEEDEKLSHALAGIVVLFCGLAHVYARERVTGLMLTGGCILIVFSVVPLAAAGSYEAPIVIGVALFTLVMCDMIGGQFAVRRFNNGKSRKLLGQLATGAVYLATAFGLSRLPTLAVPLGDSIQVPNIHLIEQQLAPSPSDFLLEYDLGL